MRKLWWEQWPDRLEMELKALDDARIPYRRDEEWFRKGILKLHLQPTVEGERLDLVAIYPQLFPYFRFQVFATNLGLPRHQNPFEGNLCLIGRSTWNWHTTDTVAGYIADPKRLPALLISARSEDRATVAHLEESQAEPFSEYYGYTPGSMLLVDSSWDLPPHVTHGELEIALQSAGNDHLRGMVKTVHGPDKAVLAEADGVIASRFNNTIRARWVRVSEPLKAPDGPGLVRLISEHNPQIAKPRWKSIGGWQTDIIGVVFPEELRQGVIGDSWVFVVRRGRGKNRSRREHAHIIRAGRYGRADLRDRIPELSALADKRVAVFGLGGIGGPAAIEFARGGIGELRLLDHDFVDPGTTVRWPLGLGAAGLAKITALPAFIAQEYPFTAIRTWDHRIGDVLRPEPEGPTDLEVLEEMLGGVDLVFDATAEPGVHHLLCDLAWARNIPYVTTHTTPGAAGGLVARLDPRRATGCWVCLQRALYEDKTIPEPPFDEAGNVQPLGCGDPTFTGAGFDVLEVTLEAVRMATGALCAGTEAGYPESTWDVAVLVLRDGDGNRVPPQWEAHELPPHTECSCTES